MPDAIADTDFVPQSLHDAFAANDFSRFRAILSDLTAAGKAAAWAAFGLDAAEQKKPEILASLLPHRPNAVSSPRQPPDLLLACVSDSNSPEVCDVVVDAGIDINIPPSYGPDLLLACVEENKVRLVNHLLSPPIAAKTGARINSMLYADMYPFLVAARSPEMVQTLLAHGDKLQGSMALHMAALRGNLSMMECLLDAGANVNENLRADQDRPENRWLKLHREDLGAPLHYAVDGRSSLSAAKLLIARGADTTMRDYKGRTVLERAESSSKGKWPELEELLG